MATLRHLSFGFPNGHGHGHHWVRARRDESGGVRVIHHGLAPRDMKKSTVSGEMGWVTKLWCCQRVELETGRDRQDF
jgi:hypothetical protein